MGILLFIIAGPALAISEESGRILVVSQHGDDENPGTVVLPIRSLERAAELARPGDTIFVREGQYPAGTRIVTSGNQRSPIIYRNFPGETPIIDGRGRSASGLILDNVDFVHVRGFEVRGIGSQEFRLNSEFAWGAILLRDTRFSRIEGNTLTPGLVSNKPKGWLGSSGIQLWSTTPEKGNSHNLIRGNDASVGWSGAHTFGPASHNVFEGNVFHHNRETEEDSDGAGQDNSARKLDWIQDKTPYNPRENSYRFNIFAYNSDDGLDLWVSVSNFVQYNWAIGNGHGSNGDGRGFKMGPGGRNITQYCLASMNRSKAFDNNGGRFNVWKNNLAFGNAGIREAGELAAQIETAEKWQANRLRQRIQGKIESFRSALVERVPPNPPRNVYLIGKQLIWEAPLSAEDGDGAAYYLVLNENHIIGITRVPMFELPSGQEQYLQVCAIDDSHRDNRSECVPLMQTRDEEKTATNAQDHPNRAP